MFCIHIALKTRENVFNGSRIKHPWLESNLLKNHASLIVLMISNRSNIIRAFRVFWAPRNQNRHHYHSISQYFSRTHYFLWCCVIQIRLCLQTKLTSVNIISWLRFSVLLCFAWLSSFPWKKAIRIQKVSLAQEIRAGFVTDLYCVAFITPRHFAGSFGIWHRISV